MGLFIFFLSPFFLIVFVLLPEMAEMAGRKRKAALIHFDLKRKGKAE